MKKVIIVGSILFLSAGCSTVDNLTDTTNGINYKQSSAIKTLEFPPDLTTPEFDTAFIIPSSGSVRASSVNNGIVDRYSGRDIKVLTTSNDMRIGSSGTMRWLEVDTSANKLWPKIRDFWRSLGIKVLKDEPRIGIMLTEWAQNQAGLPKDWLRQVLGGLFKNSFDAGTRDQYRIRVEKIEDNKTRIYLSHKGAEKVITETGVGWELRPPKKELEAEMLNRLQAFLQGDKYTRTRNSTKTDATQTSILVTLITEDDHPLLQIHENYKEAWVRTGIMLERMDLMIESRQQSQGIYKVVYNGNETVEKTGGFFSNLFKGKQTFLSKGTAYQIHIRDAGRLSEVKIMDKEGKPLAPDQSKKILARLKQEFDR